MVYPERNWILFNFGFLCIGHSRCSFSINCYCLLLLVLLIFVQRVSFSLYPGLVISSNSWKLFWEARRPCCPTHRCKESFFMFFCF